MMTQVLSYSRVLTVFCLDWNGIAASTTRMDMNIPNAYNKHATHTGLTARPPRDHMESERLD